MKDFKFFRQLSSQISQSGFFSSLLSNLCLLQLGHESTSKLYGQEFPQGKTSRNIPLQTALPIHFLCSFLLPTPHYGNKPPRGAHKSISRFLEHTSSHPHSRETHQCLLMPSAAQLLLSTNSSFVCSPLLLLVLIKKKKKRQKKSHSQPGVFQIWEV